MAILLEIKTIEMNTRNKIVQTARVQIGKPYRCHVKIKDEMTHFNYLG